MRDELQKRLDRIVELVKVRDRATQELLELLGISEGHKEIVSRETSEPEVEKPKPKALEIPREDGSTLKLEKFVPEPGECKKCTRVAAGGDGRGRHSKGCPKANGTVTVKPEKPPVTGEKPEAGYEADWRSKCCNARLLVSGGKEGTNHYTCSKCYDPCDPVAGDSEEHKKFDCEDCGKKFEADTSEDIKCDECGSSNVWPVSV